VADALDLRGASATVTDGLAAIAAVHGDGDLPRIPVRMVSGVVFAAAYRVSADEEPVEVAVNIAGSRQAWSLVHEFGRFIDHQTLGERGAFASHRHGDLDEWRVAVDASRAVRILQGILIEGGLTIVEDGLERRIPVDAGFFEIQLSYPEMWARSYAQFIALRSGDPTLTAQLLGLLRLSSEGGDAPYTLQWESADFAPILETIDQLFKRKGWRR